MDGIMDGPNRTHPDYDWCIGASELGGCVKAIAAQRLGYAAIAAPESMQEAYRRGHEHEWQCLEAMKLDVWGTILELQPEYLIDCGDRVGIIVHPDAIALPGTREVVLEIKAPTAWASFERAYKTANYSDPYMHKIAWQVSCQMVATGLEAVVACLDDGQVRTFGIELPPFTSEQILSRVQEIKAIVASGALPVACSQADWPCPVFYLHEDEEMDNDEIMDGLLAAYAGAVATEKDAKAGKEAIREAIEARLTGETYQGKAGKVTRYSRVSTTYDTKKMIEDGMDLTAYAKTVESNVVKITPTVHERAPLPFASEVVGGDTPDAPSPGVAS